VNLSEEGNDTVQVYVVKANAGGKLAQLDSTLIDGTAKKMAIDSLGNFIDLVLKQKQKDNQFQPDSNSSLDTLLSNANT
jgi:hypothetical protein